MIQISDTVFLSGDEIEMHAVRSRGAGGQNVNKVSTAIHLRFDIRASSLPDFYKAKLLARSDHRITKDGIIVIKAQQHRSQDQNRNEAIERLRELIRSAVAVRRKRKPTRPSRSSQARRLNRKVNRGRLKALRGKVQPE